MPRVCFPFMCARRGIACYSTTVYKLCSRSFGVTERGGGVPQRRIAHSWKSKIAGHFEQAHGSAGVRLKTIARAMRLNQGLSVSRRFRARSLARWGPSLQSGILSAFGCAPRLPPCIGTVLQGIPIPYSWSGGMGTLR